MKRSATRKEHMMGVYPHIREKHGVKSSGFDTPTLSNFSFHLSNLSFPISFTRCVLLLSP